MAIILIVEDEPFLAEMYRDKFIKSGFEILLTNSAEDGLKVAKEYKPDLILLDILLPNENGTSLLAWMREEMSIAHVPVLVFSNYDDEEMRNKALDLGAKDYLIKTNHTPGEIISRIKDLLNEK